MANIRVCANNIQATLRVAVSSELKENMLISCDDLRKLQVIPADFPNAVLAVALTPEGEPYAEIRLHSQ